MWNWQQKDWPNFRYDLKILQEIEKEFLIKSGIFIGASDAISEDEKNNLIINIISEEAFKTSEIEGEYLNRDSVQSSIKRHFGLKISVGKITAAEKGISDMMVDLYNNYNKPLSHEILFKWHNMLSNGRSDLKNIGSYRTHAEPMQVISGPLHNLNIHFEAPPSRNIIKEMDRFINWFNNTSPSSDNSLPALIRAGITHLYFVSIHPFEDGNGRIARALAEKSLSEAIGQPVLISISHIIQNAKKLYYQMLERSNKNNEITDWLLYFGRVIIEAQNYTQKNIAFLIEKTKFYDKIYGNLNLRQEKVIRRMFLEGITGFKGGLSAENYISITQTSRATATRDLHDLVEKAFFYKKGELKHTRYYLNIKF